MTQEPAESEPNWAGLQLRILSGSILAVVVIVANLLGPMAFALVVAVVSILVFREWDRLVETVSDTFGGRTLRVSLFAAGLAPALVGLSAGIYPMCLFLILLVGLVLHRTDRWAWRLAGIGYAAVPAFALVFLRMDTAYGETIVFGMLALVWITDVAAYLVGSQIGGPKLWRAVSPGKTWSGAIGGLVAALVLAALAVLLNLIPTSFVAAILIGGMLGIVAQAGDLLESHIKRRFGAKDTGQLIPGHGGVMDRVDSLVAVSCVCAGVALLLGATDQPATALMSL